MLAILFVEVGLFFAGLGEEEIFKLDSQVGFKHMTNKRITWRSEGLGTSYFDAHGLREPNVTLIKPAGTYRIALLGDSLTESLQVPLEQSFSYAMEKGLQEQTHKQIQVLNFGTSGYSTAQEYLQLKNDVLAFKPDLVLLCYNTRDCFENWSPPDEVLTNVRPAALHLPGGKLVVDSSPVALWMKSPRARGLRNFDFFRQHSRLWGLLAAAELDLSMHNETYKRVLFFLTKPGKALRQTGNEINTWIKAKLNPPAVPIENASTGVPGSQAAVEASTSQDTSKPLTTAQNVSTGNKTAIDSATNPSASTVNARTDVASSEAVVDAATTQEKSRPVASAKNASNDSASAGNIASTNSASKVSAGASSTGSAGFQPASKTTAVAKISTKSIPAKNVSPSATPADPSATYRGLIERTLGSLLSEMKNETAKNGGKFAVVALPVRAALSIRNGMEDKFCNMSYGDELTMLNKVSQPYNIPIIDLQEPAKQLSDQEKDYLFYLVHLTPRGHKFVASQLTPAVERIVAGKETP